MGLMLDGSYRNPAGLSMTMSNIQFLFSGVGHSRYSKTLKKVFERFKNRDQWTELSKRAHAIKSALELLSSIQKVKTESILDVDGEGYAEGDSKVGLHRKYERNPKNKKKKIKAFQKDHKGKLHCEVCNFDFMAQYGLRGKGFIECHHKKPIHTLDGKTNVSMKDLVLLCSNCHRMIHRKKPWLTPEDLKRLISKK
jgi:5-methylcytosine-specific restriction protein A